MRSSHGDRRARNQYRDGDVLSWAFLTTPSAEPNDAAGRLMLGLADEPVDSRRQHPLYMPAGEISVTDPDGYLLVIGQLDG